MMKNHHCELTVPSSKNYICKSRQLHHTGPQSLSNAFTYQIIDKSLSQQIKYYRNIFLGLVLLNSFGLNSTFV